MQGVEHNVKIKVFLRQHPVGSVAVISDQPREMNPIGHPRFQGFRSLLFILAHPNQNHIRRLFHWPRAGAVTPIRMVGGIEIVLQRSIFPQTIPRQVVFRIHHIFGFRGQPQFDVGVVGIGDGRLHRQGVAVPGHALADYFGVFLHKGGLTLRQSLFLPPGEELPEPLRLRQCHIGAARQNQHRRPDGRRQRRPEPADRDFRPEFFRFLQNAPIQVCHAHQ